MTKWYFYHTYGLNVASEIELPELRVADPAPGAAITIALAALPEALEGAQVKGSYLQVAGDQCQINVANIARYRVEQGRWIWVDPVPGAAPGDVRLYLLGSALGTLLHQRRCLPLHVSAVATPSGVWAFTGESGAGKSTLAAALHYHFGWSLLSDDVGVIEPDESGQPLFHPGPPRLKLWQDALAHFEIDRDGLIADQTRTDKFHLPLEHGFHHEPRCLRVLVMLERAHDEEPPGLTRIGGMASFQAVMGAIYRPEIAQLLVDQERLFRQCTALASRIQVYRYRRPRLLAKLADGLQLLFEQVAELEREYHDQTASGLNRGVRMEPEKIVENP